MKEKMTKKRYEDLKKELHILSTQKREEIAEKLRVTRAFGDLSENAEYHEAKKLQGELEYKIKIIDNQLRNVEVVDKISTDMIQIGTNITLINQDTKKEVKYSLVNVGDADIVNKAISGDSPIGNALMGHKVGDIVKINLPAGDIVYTVKSID